METLVKPRAGNVRTAKTRNTANNSIKNDALFALELIQQKSILLGLDSMSLDAINDEIKNARQEK